MLLIIFFLIFSVLHAQKFPQIEGWKISADVLRYSPENLWEYINGGADQFIDYGFESLQATELSQNLVLINTDIYDMGLPLNAFGIYMAQKPERSNIYDIGTESLISFPAQCLLLKDRYFVKIHVLKGELTEKIGFNLLNALSKALPGQEKFPEEFLLLPDFGRKEKSLGYVRTNFLGMGELNNCIYATYLDNDTEFQYFVAIPDLNNSISVSWNTIKNKWNSIQWEGENIFFRNIPYKGFVGVIQKDQYLLGIAKVSDIANLKERIIIFSNYSGH